MAESQVLGNHKTGCKIAEMIVIMSACGNPDFGQAQDIGIPIKQKLVSTFEEASQACKEYITEYGLGGGNWIGGAVLNVTNRQQIAYISYNGRIWTKLEDWMKCSWLQK